VSRGFFPLDEEVGVVDGGWSNEVVRLAVWLSGQVSFEQAAEVLRQVGRVEMSASSIWRRTEKWGNALLAVEDEERRRANAVPSREQPQAGEVKHNQPMGFSLDGWMLNIRGEGWKEVKSASIFEVEQREVVDRKMGEKVEQAQAQAMSYVAHLGGPEVFGEKLWTEGMRRQLHTAYEKACISDAAAWIWGICMDYFPETEQIVDWYHALQHLHTAAAVLYGDTIDKAKQWVEAHTTTLFQGHAARIAQGLDKLAAHHAGEPAKKLQEQAGFFRNHQRRMRYLDYREQGWPIGSGTIESACKQFQSRMTGPGMRWSRPGAERMLAIRATILSDTFQQRWRALLNSPAF
jgi:hypothetical protein